MISPYPILHYCLGLGMASQSLMLLRKGKKRLCSEPPVTRLPRGEITTPPAPRVRFLRNHKRRARAMPMVGWLPACLPSSVALSATASPHQAVRLLGTAAAGRMYNPMGGNLTFRVRCLQQASFWKGQSVSTLYLRIATLQFPWRLKTCLG